MADRYIRQIEFTNSVYLPDCPVALEKGAVLLDTKTNTYQLQLKLSNIGTQGITSARLYVEALDQEGNPAYPGLFCDYNENAAVGSAFGSKRLLPLPGGQAAAFRVYVEEITTIDGVTAVFDRSRYIADNEPRDIAALRENAFQADLAERARQEKVRKTMWGAKWYHLVFAINILLSILVPFPGMSIYVVIVQILIVCSLWVFVWTSMGTPQVLKRSAMAALLIVALSLLCLGLFMLNPPFYRRALSGMLFNAFFWRCIIGFLPFLSIFFNARRFDKSLNFTQSLLFWLEPRQAEKVEAQVQRYALKIRKGQTEKICTACGAKILQEAKFCVKCGAKTDGQ
jgi:ribosomal protein L40E